MRIGSLFAGFGGLELGLERAGLGHVVFQVERDPYCQAVLATHWPNVPRFDDVRTATAAVLPPCDILCGGFPCQDVSSAGKRRGLGTEDDPTARSGLWFEFARLIEDLAPAWVVIENVASGASQWVPRVRRSLWTRGYDSLPLGIAASEVGARHRRERVFIVARHAHVDDDGLPTLLQSYARKDQRAQAPERSEAAANAVRHRLRGWADQPGGQAGSGGEGTPVAGEAAADVAEFRRDEGAALSWGREPESEGGDSTSEGPCLSPGFGHPALPALVRAVHGVPEWMDRRARAAGWTAPSRPSPEEDPKAYRRWLKQRGKVLGKHNRGWTPALVRMARIKGLGNSVVPQCAEEVGRFILWLMSQNIPKRG